MEPISTAIALAQAAPAIVRWLTSDDKAATAANTVVEVAKAVTYQSTGDDALAAIRADPQLALAFKQRIAELEADMDKAYLADVADARARDVALMQAGQRNWRAHVMFGSAYTVVLVLLYAIWRTPTFDEFAKATMTLILGRFLGYLDTIYNFEFGTTRSSKDKDKTISNLSR